MTVPETAPPAAQPDENQSPASSPVAAAALGLVGILFLVSAWAKLHAPGVFEATLVKQEIFASRDVAAWPSRLLIAFELALGIGLLQPWRRRSFFAPAAGLTLIAFSIWLGYLILAGKNLEDCGCFGELMKISPGVALIRNIVFLAIIAAAWRRLGERTGWSGPITIAIISIVTTMAIAPITAGAPPPPDNGDTTAPPSPVTTFRDFSDGPNTLLEGVHLVAFFSLECEHCMQVAGDLAAHADQLPPIRVIYFGEASKVPEFEGMSGSAFPWHLTDPGRFFDFIGDAPPRVYLLQHGKEIARWDQGDFNVQSVIQSVPE
jgi:hypothetical protein